MLLSSCCSTVFFFFSYLSSAAVSSFLTHRVLPFWIENISHPLSATSTCITWKILNFYNSVLLLPFLLLAWVKCQLEFLLCLVVVSFLGCVVVAFRLYCWRYLNEQPWCTFLVISSCYDKVSNVETGERGSKVDGKLNKSLFNSDLRINRKTRRKFHAAHNGSERPFPLLLLPSPELVMF